MTAIDAVLFDQHGNFIGPVSEVIGGTLNTRFIIQVSEEMFRARRSQLKPSDRVYYYNCDHLEVDHHTRMDEEQPLELCQPRQAIRNLPQTHKKFTKMILKSVINNLRNMGVDELDDSIDHQLREQGSRLANKSTSITSMIFKTYQDKNHIASFKEQLKKKRYQKYKKRIMQQFHHFQEEETSKGQLSDRGHHPPAQGPSGELQSRFAPVECCDDTIEDELGMLGKRAPLNSDRIKKRKKKGSEAVATSQLKSSGSSRLSHISEPSPMMLPAGKGVISGGAFLATGSGQLNTVQRNLTPTGYRKSDIHSEQAIEDELRMHHLTSAEFGQVSRQVSFNSPSSVKVGLGQQCSYWQHLGSPGDVQGFPHR